MFFSFKKKQADTIIISIRIESAIELEGQMKMKEMCFQRFLENIKDSAAWIELGRSFHQERTVKSTKVLS